MIVDMVEGQTSVHTVREPLINRSARIAEFSAESEPLKMVRHPYPRDGDLTKRRVFALAVGVGRGSQSLPKISANVEIAVQASRLSTTPVMKIDNVGGLPYHFPLPAFSTVLRYERRQSRVSTPRFHLLHRESIRSTSVVSTLESTGDADAINRFGTRLRLDLTHTPSLTLRNSTRALTFSPDGKLLASGARLWSVDNGNEIDAFEEDDSRVWALAFSPDGKLLASAGWWNRLKQRAIRQIWRVLRSMVRQRWRVSLCSQKRL